MEAAFRLVSFILLWALPGFGLFSHATAGTRDGGGGDPTEIRIDAIRSDILSWIDQGGAQGLVLPERVSYDFYVDRMRDALTPQAVIVGVVTAADEAATSDEEQRVVVNGQPKTCRGFISRKDGLRHILCNVERFSLAMESDQYRLIHHEYAGLAGVEFNLGAASDYGISSQLTDFLMPQVVLKLAIKRHAPSGEVPACSSVNPRKLSVGAMCVTSKGIVFKRLSNDKYGERWKDLSAQITWHDSISEFRFSHEESLRMCEEETLYLPRRHDFERGEANGFREVLPNMIQQYWTSSYSDEEADTKWVFFAYEGKLVRFYVGSGATFRRNYLVRCVTRN